MIYILLALAVNLAVSLIVYNSSKNRDCNSTWIFWASFLFSPLVGMFLVLTSRERTKEEIEQSEENKIWTQKEDWIQKNPARVDDLLTITFGVLGVIFMLFVFYPRG
jgi:hypothetical protein